MKSQMSDFSWFLERNSGKFTALATAGTVAFATISAWISKSINEYAKVEKVHIWLMNALWDKKQAQDMIDMIEDISKKTPFEFQKLSESMLKLVNRGFVPTEKEIISLWDLASSQTKDFDQLVEAMLDAQTWQFERLKEFGIQAEKNWSRVTFTFKNQKKTVDATSDAIKDYILSLWQMKWVVWLMNEMSKSIEWVRSTFNDSISSMGREIWKIIWPALKDFLVYMTPVLDNIWEWIKNNPELTKTLIIVWAWLSWLAVWLWLVWLALPPIIAWFGLMTWTVGLVSVWLVSLWVAFYVFRDKIASIFDSIRAKAIERYNSISSVFAQITDMINSSWIASAISVAFWPLWSVLSTVNTLIGAMGNLFAQRWWELVWAWVRSLQSRWWQVQNITYNNNYSSQQSRQPALRWKVTVTNIFDQYMWYGSVIWI